MTFAVFAGDNAGRRHGHPRRSRGCPDALDLFMETGCRVGQAIAGLVSVLDPVVVTPTRWPTRSAPPTWPAAAGHTDCHRRETSAERRGRYDAAERRTPYAVAVAVAVAVRSIRRIPQCRISSRGGRTAGHRVDHWDVPA
ncbi:hypothetical protein [Streptomyces albicerus]|uniref:hypothetical protein n=1 Tax=Streptomyces albicerus TaxID=2569859 RepID=UPI00124B4FF6|nr:hypothetical protein [Streptomyces albicerus]